MKKTIFIVPGFKHSAKESQYDWMNGFFKSKGFIVRRLDISWKNHVMSSYVDEFSEYYKRYKTDTNYVLGFSYGAMTAFISAKQLEPDKLFLCSLSPYFNEDLQKLKPWWKVYIGIHRALDFKKFKAREIAKEIKLPTFIFYGSSEGEKYPQLKLRCEETAKLIHNAQLIIAKNAPHRIDHQSYINAIQSVFP